jgi:cytochrome b6-f complex iron-sulfur subunit
MERREFLGSISGPVVAVCAVCMGACSKSADTTAASTPAGTNPAPVANLTIDLGSNLTTVGSSLVQGGVIVVRLSSGNTASSFTAVQVACTHEGTAINFNAANNQFVCPNHGSTFTTAGAVTIGPASSALKRYNIVISGNTMTITG